MLEEIALGSCRICPRNCGVDRLKGEKGACRSGAQLKISSIGPHFGEEPMISGTKGSGTVFFSNCNLKCLFCQNYQISQEGLGHRMSEEDLAAKMIELQIAGCHNINLVSPTHFIPQIIKTVLIAKEKGLKIPIVYNSNGYESVDSLRSLKGLIDIYLPDIKYSDDENAFKFSGIKRYVAANRAAIAEMFGQVGNLILDDSGIATRGLLVRHLVLPDDIAESRGSLTYLASLSKKLWISIMSQYHPCHKAVNHDRLGRKLRIDEYKTVLDTALELGFDNLLTQEMDSSDVLLPDFERANPFSGRV